MIFSTYSSSLTITDSALELSVLLMHVKRTTKLYTKVVFVSVTNIGENTTKILKLLFFIINVHSATSNQISTHKKLNFVSYKQYVFHLLTSRNAKKESNRPEYIVRFLTLSEKKRLTNH